MTHYGKSACARIAKNIMWQVYCNLTYYESRHSLPYGRGSVLNRALAERSKTTGSRAPEHAGSETTGRMARQHASRDQAAKRLFTARRARSKRIRTAVSVHP